MNWRNTRTLVTGGASFIGSHLVDRLLLSDVEHVTVLDDFNNFYDPHIKRENITEHLKDPRYKLVETDIRDRAALENVFQQSRFDCLVHLAALKQPVGTEVDAVGQRRFGGRHGLILRCPNAS